MVRAHAVHSNRSTLCTLVLKNRTAPSITLTYCALIINAKMPSTAMLVTIAVAKTPTELVVGIGIRPSDREAHAKTA